MSNEIKKIFLPSFSQREAKPEDWKSLRPPPNQISSEQKPFKREEQFQIPVDPAIKQKFDQLLQRLPKADEEIENDGVTDLPPGYSVVVLLYKDLNFMNEVRFESPEIVNAYLAKEHPQILTYLKAHHLRVITQVIGKGQWDEKVLASKEGPDPKPEPEPGSVCAAAEAVAAAGATSAAVAAARAEVKAAAAASVVAAVNSGVVACANSFANGKGTSV